MHWCCFISTHVYDVVCWGVRKYIRGDLIMILMMIFFE